MLYFAKKKARRAVAKKHPWELSDEFWNLVEPLIPKRKREKGRKYIRKAGGGRKPMPARQAFAGILYVLRTGIQWKALPAEFGSPSSVHRYFRAWAAAGLFLRIWKRGLAEYDEMAGISWKWQSVDGCMTKAPTAREAAGRNPTDRGKKGDEAARPRGRAWGPAVDSRHRGEPS